MHSFQLLIANELRLFQNDGLNYLLLYVERNGPVIIKSWIQRILRKILN